MLKTIKFVMDGGLRMQDIAALPPLSAHEVKRPKTKSPTARSLELLRKSYPLVQVVEHWNPHARIRQDLFGIIDIVAVGEDVMAVQSTSDTNVAKRVAKIAESDALPVLIKSGIRVVVHGWKKNREGRWVCRVVEM